MPGAQGLGQIVGPNIAATLLGAHLGCSAVFLMCTGAALVGLIGCGTMYLCLRRTIPTLGDTSQGGGTRGGGARTMELPPGGADVVESWMACVRVVGPGKSAARSKIDSGKQMAFS
jgi:hypothetical protein